MKKLLLDAGVPERQVRRELAEACGISPQAVAQWFSESTKKISPDYIAAVAKKWGSNSDYLITGEYPKHTRITHEVQEDSAGYSNVVDTGIRIEGEIPLISYVQAGSFGEAIDNFEPGDAEEWLPKPPNTGKRSYALTVTGDSMTNPLAGHTSFPEGAIIVVDPEAETLPGDYVIAKDNNENEATFKKLVKDGDRYYLKPLNPQYQMIEVTESIVICGKITNMLQRF